MKRITKEEAVELNQNFIKTKGKALDRIVEKLNKKPKEKDAISSWFSLEDIKEYIAYIEKEGKEKGIDVNGLRVYFGAYSDTEEEKKKGKKNLSTVFFVPTKPRVGAMQKDGLSDDEGGSDVTEIDGLNKGGFGYPPSATYPQ